MKQRLILTLFAGLLYLATRFGTCVSDTFTQYMGVPPFIVVGLPALLGLAIMAVWNFACLFRCWKQERARALIPLLVVVPFYAASTYVCNAGHARYASILTTNRQAFEEVITQAQDRFSQHVYTSNYVHVQAFNPNNSRLPYQVYATMETNRTLSVRFLKPITITHHHRGFFYRSDGLFEPVLMKWETKRESIVKKIDVHWCLMTD